MPISNWKFIAAVNTDINATNDTSPGFYRNINTVQMRLQSDLASRESIRYKISENNSTISVFSTKNNVLLGSQKTIYECQLKIFLKIILFSKFLHLRQAQ